MVFPGKLLGAVSLLIIMVKLEGEVRVADLA
jgi:hypothetical protein